MNPFPSSESEASTEVKQAFVFPASFAQRRLWFLDQFEPDSAFYNIPAFIPLPGALDLDVLRQSLNLLVQRHESLRTSFDVVDETLVQVIAPSFTLELPIYDLTALAENTREAEGQRLANLEAQKPFDLKRGPLIRCPLLKRGDHDHVLLLTIHHIVADGWSMDVLYRELAIIYKTLVAGEHLSLPELPIQYADFAAWQLQWFSGPVYESQLEYWSKQLAGIQPVLELPTDRPRPPIQVFRGGLHAFSLSPSLGESLKLVCRQEQVTPFMALLAAFKTLLYRYTGQEDLVVGTPIANRARPELEGIVGFFANTLVLRTRLDGSLTFRRLLARLREVTLAAYAHQDMPFEKLVEALSPRRSLSYNPLFQVMFVLQNIGKVVSANGGPQQQQDSGPLTIDTGAAKFDLTLILAETSQGFEAGLEYNSELFDPQTIARMAKHFETLLAAAVVDLDQPLATLSILSQSEILAFADWNMTAARFKEQCVHELFEAQVERTPETVAVAFAEQTLNYRELNARANFWSHRLLDLGVGPDTCVGICMERSIEAIVAVLAVLKAGAAYLPLDPAYPHKRLAFMIADARVRLLLTQQTLKDSLPRADDVQVLVLDEKDQEMPEDNPRGAATPNNLAYVIYTSGSTGSPKAVAMPHRALANMLNWQMARSDVHAGDRTLQFASLSFDVCFQEIFSTLCAGGTLVLIGEEERRDPKLIWQLLEHTKVNRLFLPYVALQQLAESARQIVKLPSSLREIVTAGEQPYATSQMVEMFERLDCAFYNQYGPSETHVATELKLSGPASLWPFRPAIGRPIQNLTICLLDNYRQLVPIGIPGEIYIGGVALARGYLHRNNLTAERFLPDPDGATQVGDRLYRTGDQARYLSDGSIEFLGRLDNQIKVRGFRIEPAEIELTLCQHPSVSMAAVVAHPDGLGELRLVAYIKLMPQSSATVEDLREHLGTSLPEQMLPAIFMFVDSMPLTSTGKLNRNALPKPENLTVATGSIFVAPRTPIEENLAKAWCELLALESVGVLDNFFDLGGHSLLATRVVSRIRDVFHVDLPVRALFETPTIEGLALAIVQASVEKEDEDEVQRLLTALE
jgi:amino acid adenylation domain-containing protein